MAAPVGGLLWAAAAFVARVSFQKIQAMRKGHRFDAFDRPPPPSPALYTGRAESDIDTASEQVDTTSEHEITPSVKKQNGKFF